MPTLDITRPNLIQSSWLARDIRQRAESYGISLDEAAQQLADHSWAEIESWCRRSEAFQVASQIQPVAWPLISKPEDAAWVGQRAQIKIEELGLTKEEIPLMQHNWDLLIKLLDDHDQVELAAWFREFIS